MRKYELNELMEALEKKPTTWWNELFSDIQEAIEYFDIEEGTTDSVSIDDRDIMFKWLIEHGEIDQDEAEEEILNGCSWDVALKYIQKGLKNIREAN